MYTSIWGKANGGLDSASAVDPSSDPICNVVKFGRGFGLPPAEKFRSGHLPSDSVPVSRALYEDVDDTESGSDMDLSSGQEDEVYGGQYSPASSCMSTVTKDLQYKNLRNREFPCKDVPSAPPVDCRIGIEEMGGGKDFMNNHIPSSIDRINNLASEEPSLSCNSQFLNQKDDGAELFKRSSAGTGVNEAGNSIPGRFPTFHASAQGPWCGVICYEACVRLCLNSWAKGFADEASYFLNAECALLQKAFDLQNVLLQPEEELLAKQSSSLVSERAASKPKRTCGKMKVQVRKVKIGQEQPTGCSLSSLNLNIIKVEPLRQHISNVNLRLYSGWRAARRVHVTPHFPPNGTFSQQSLAYMRASARYMKEVSTVFKNGMATVRSSSSTYEVVPETYTCLLRLKSTPEEDLVRMHPGPGESRVFFPDNHGDDLIIEVRDSKGSYCGRVLAQVAVIADDPSDKLRWWPMYHEPKHELVGRVQLYINYSTTPDENNNLKCGCVAETVAYDFALEVAMRAQNFQQRSLTIHGPWKWLVTEFASYYGVSDAYTKLRYLTYVMDVATPTKDCLDIVCDLLLPVITKGNRKIVLSHQEKHLIEMGLVRKPEGVNFEEINELQRQCINMFNHCWSPRANNSHVCEYIVPNRLLGEIEDQVQQILSLAFENYKSLDESAPSGMMDVFSPATGSAAPALAPAVKLYSLLHDILSPEAQLKFCKYFQAAARKRSRRHISETDESISSNDVAVLDPASFSKSYRKMTSLILSIKNEIRTDIQINDQHVLPSFIDLPNLCASIYSMDLSSRLRSFLVASPPTGPSPPVAELVIATADFQRDLASWNINLVKNGVDAKELFHLYITLWIQDKRLSLLELCKAEKVRWSGVRTEYSTTPFVDDMYEQLKQMLNEYEVIICRWPEYTVALETAIADVEKAIIEALEKQYTDVLAPLKPKNFGLKYVQKLAKRNPEIYYVPDELGILLNSMKRMLDVLRPTIETKLKSWKSWISDDVKAGAGEYFREITAVLRSNFRSYWQAVAEKLVENTKMEKTTKLNKIIEEFKETMVESDIHDRMQPLKDLLIKTIDHLHSIVEPCVFVDISRDVWDRMGKEILHVLQVKKENRSWYKGSRFALSIMDEIFVSEMEKLLGNAVQKKDLEPPTSIKEARSILC